MILVNKRWDAISKIYAITLNLSKFETEIMKRVTNTFNRR